MQLASDTVYIYLYYKCIYLYIYVNIYLKRRGALHLILVPSSHIIAGIHNADVFMALTRLFLVYAACRPRPNPRARPYSPVMQPQVEIIGWKQRALGRQYIQLTPRCRIA